MGPALSSAQSAPSTPAQPTTHGRLHPVHHHPLALAGGGRDAAVIVAVLAVVVIAVLLVLIGIGTFSGSVSPTPFQGATTGSGCVWTPYSLHLPSQSTVRFGWGVTSNAVETLSVSGPDGSVYSENGTGGTGSFTGAAGTYEFSGSSCHTATINIAGIFY